MTTLAPESPNAETTLADGVIAARPAGPAGRSRESIVLLVFVVACLLLVAVMLVAGNAAAFGADPMAGT